MTFAATVLVDTSVWIDFFAKEPGRSGAFLKTLIERGAPCAVCGPVVAEVLQGIRDPRTRARIGAVIDQFEYLEDRGKATWLAAADAYRACRASGITPRSLVDLVIAQVAVEHDAELLHLDRDYEGIAQLLPTLRVRRPLDG